MLQDKEESLCKRPPSEDVPSSSATPPTDALSPSLLELASRGDGEGLLRLLAEGGVDVRGAPPRAANGDTALHAAAGGGHLTAVMALLGAGAHAHAAGHRQRSPLHCAVAHGHLAVAQRLLDAGADVHAKDEDGATALELAVGNGHADVASFLLEKGSQADVKLATSAISQDNDALLELFLLKGVSVDALDENGEPLLVLAAKAKRWKIVQYLLANGASPTKCKSSAECALALASEDGQEMVVRRLLCTGAARNIEQMEEAIQRAKDIAVVRVLKGFRRDYFRRVNMTNLLSETPRI